VIGSLQESYTAIPEINIEGLTADIIEQLHDEMAHALGVAPSQAKTPATGRELVASVASMVHKMNEDSMSRRDFEDEVESEVKYRVDRAIDKAVAEERELCQKEVTSLKTRLAEVEARLAKERGK